MELAPSPIQSVTRRLGRAVYRAQQISFLFNATVMQEAARRLAGVSRPELPPSAMKTLQARYRELLDRDLANVEAGLYPRELLFQIPVRDYVRTFPRLLRDAPRTVRRMRKNHFKDLPDSVDLESYPAYYRRTFHWQTDGYFSDRSAALYDLGVEMLFRGTADIMRRQIIPPVSRFLSDSAGPNARLLDVACGTGRTLKQLATAHPHLKYHGVDLSPYYVKAARRLLRDVSEVSLVAENAERLPYVHGYFDVATCVYLFHELPKDARRNVVREVMRVLRPGGLFVVEDSAQLSDSADIAAALGNFPRDFHEPYYKGYIRDDLAEMLAECGFDVVSSEPHMVAKVVVARKPAH